MTVFLPLDTSFISLLTAAISFLARQRTASVLFRWPNMTWLSRLLSSSKCDSMVISVELIGRGSQEDESLAQLDEKNGIKSDQLKRAVWKMKKTNLTVWCCCRWTTPPQGWAVPWWCTPQTGLRLNRGEGPLNLQWLQALQHQGAEEMVLSSEHKHEIQRDCCSDVC